MINNKKKVKKEWEIGKIFIIKNKKIININLNHKFKKKLKWISYINNKRTIKKLNMIRIM